MPGTQYGPRKPYLSVVQGSLRQKVDERTENAVEREYELTDKYGTKTKAVKYELIFKEWYGLIRDLRIKDTDFGTALEIEFEDAILTVSVESRYFRSFASKILDIDINQIVGIQPYDFEANGDKRVGFSITQNGRKAANVFWNDIDSCYANGYPIPQGDTKHYRKNDWKAYGIVVEKFLTEKLEEFAKKIDKAVSSESLEQPELEDSIEQPFQEDEQGIPLVGIKKESEDEVRLEDVPF